MKLPIKSIAATILSGAVICTTYLSTEQPIELSNDVSFQTEPERIEQVYGSCVISFVSHVYDGDTFSVFIKEWPDVIGDNISVRVYGVDTPEMTDRRPEINSLAKTAKNFTESFLQNAKIIELKNLRRDKYFRLNAEVYADGRNLANALINAKLGKPYFGDTKEIWTVADYNAYVAKLWRKPSFRSK